MQRVGGSPRSEAQEGAADQIPPAPQEIGPDGKPGPQPSRHATAAILIGLTLLALALRVARLDFQPLWWDEGYSVWFARQPLPQLLQLTALDIHPPLYYALLGGWTRLFGPGPVALRLFSAVAGVLTVPLIYLAGRALWGRRAGLLAALLLAFNPFHIFYSQEVRMYALAALWGLLAVLFALLWLNLTARGDRPKAAWLGGYVLALTLALYTLYYAAFLALGLAVAGLAVLWMEPASAGPARWRRTAAWLGAHGVTLLLYLPWLLYAGPKLVPYVSQKIVADSDHPLALPAYLARHLSAFVAGHLEGPLAPWWPLALLALIPAGWGLVRLLQTRRKGDASADRSRLLVAFLLIALTVMLAAGWLVNLRFPFFPGRGERLLLVALPLFLLLMTMALTATERGKRAVAGSSGRTPSASNTSRTTEALLALTAFLLIAVVSLAAFYLVPRYPEEDYRPLIGQVNQWGQPGDTVLAVFPWQVGYFWSYGDPDGPQPELIAEESVTSQVEETLDRALAQGHLWFPEHLALGGMLERDIESALAGRSYVLANRWYSPSTRLTGWAGRQDESAGQAAPAIAFAGGPQLEAMNVRPTTVTAANQAVLVDIDWQTGSIGPDRRVGLRLADEIGGTWAQQDLPASSAAGPDRMALLVPSATPPGRYRLLLSVRNGADTPALDVLDAAERPQGTEVYVADIAVETPATPPSPQTLAVEHALDATLGEEAVRLLGYSATGGPLAPGGDLKVSLFWQALPGLAGSADLSAFLQLLDGNGQVAAGWEGPPIAWHATSAWQPNEFVRSQHSLRLPATVSDGRYQLIAGLFDPINGRRLSVTPEGFRPRSRDHVDLGQVEVAGRPHRYEPPMPTTPFPAQLERLGGLVGFDLDAQQVTPGQALDLVLHWQARETTGDRLSVFVHLVDENSRFLGQSDGEPGQGELPTSGWVPDEYLIDPHRLSVAPDALPGPAKLVIGLYDPTTGQRVRWLDAAGGTDGDALVLPTTVTVVSSSPDP